jgi:pimeloyl-ACP methyl ester carboxylesterase
MTGFAQRRRAWTRAVGGSVLLCAVALVSGCSTPAQRIDAIATEAGMTREVVRGKAFEHVVYRNGRPATGRTLHVYIEGDGRPYLDRWTASPDPTPRRPLMLQLMALDTEAALYIGRPCYFGLATNSPCTPLDWTLQRFGPEVVASMASVIRSAVVAAQAPELRLFGHSGGGTLAVLLARELPEVTQVVTLAGNLDPAAWAALHGYSPLTGSLDPLQGGPLPATTTQLHLGGERDRNVPPALMAQAARTLGAAEGVRIMAGADHACCWRQVWPQVLAGDPAVLALPQAAGL